MNKSQRERNLERILESIHAIKRVMSARHDSAERPACHGRAHTPITPAQWEALATVLKKGSLSVGELARALGVSSSAATQLVDELVQKGYLLRRESADDRRVQTLSLNERSRTEFASVRAEFAGHFARLFQGLNDDELAQYARLSQKVAESALESRND